MVHRGPGESLNSELLEQCCEAGTAVCAVRPGSREPQGLLTTRPVARAAGGLNFKLNGHVYLLATISHSAGLERLVSEPAINTQRHLQLPSMGTRYLPGIG